jgi:hypothetical protein
MTSVVQVGVRVVDGECMPVPDLEVGARFKYEHIPSSWCSECTDGDGLALFHDEHPEPPIEVTFYVDDQPCDTFPVEDGATLVLEL